MEKLLPAIPAKRYFTIGEVSDLCGVKPYVLRYWEQEFTQLKPMKRRGNRRYYQHHEVLLIRRIRELLYDQGFTISGARNQLGESATPHRVGAASTAMALDVEPGRSDAAALNGDEPSQDSIETSAEAEPATACPPVAELAMAQLRQELLSIRALLVS